MVGCGCGLDFFSVFRPPPPSLGGVGSKIKRFHAFILATSSWSLVKPEGGHGRDRTCPHPAFMHTATKIPRIFECKTEHNHMELDSLLLRPSCGDGGLLASSCAGDGAPGGRPAGVALVDGGSVAELALAVRERVASGLLRRPKLATWLVASISEARSEAAAAAAASVA